MSVKAMSRVWELELHHAERLVLLALADHADHLGANIYPSIGLIAWKTGYSESQVRRIMQQLVSARLLVVVCEGGGRGKPTEYRFDLEAGTVKTPYVPSNDGGRGATPTYNRQFVHTGRRDGFLCAKCGRLEPLELDHIIPVSRGGPHHPDNFQLLCAPCNSKKGATVADYRRLDRKDSPL